jgi:EmrB/QacA subfamily drug resistance transporter
MEFDTAARSPRPQDGLESAAARRWALLIISLATLMVGVDTAIVSVALPSAQRELGISDETRQWVLTAYTLAYGGLLLLGGRLADRLGHRRTLLIGTIGFVCASALSGAAVNGPMLFAGRALQGTFGALLVPSTRSLLVLIFHEPRERAWALGIFTAMLIGGAVFGFILSGVITNYLSWRWTLYVNVPVAALVALGVLRVLPDFAGDRSVRIDVPGVVLAVGAMVALVFGLSQAASSGWNSTAVVIPLVLGVVLLAAFLWLESQVPSPLLPLRVLADRNRAGAFVALGLNSFSNFGMLLVLTYELQVVLRASPLLTGLALVPWALASAVGAALIGARLMPRMPARRLLTPGLLSCSFGLVLLSQMTPATSYMPLIFIAQLFLGFGAGLNGTPAINAALSGVLTADTGVTSAMSSTSNQIGASIGTAVLSTIAAGATASFAGSGGEPAALVHGFTTATFIGSIVVFAGALVVGSLVDVNPARGGRGTGDGR